MTILYSWHRDPLKFGIAVLLNEPADSYLKFLRLFDANHLRNGGFLHEGKNLKLLRFLNLNNLVIAGLPASTKTKTKMRRISGAPSRTTNHESRNLETANTGACRGETNSRKPQLSQVSLSDN